MFPQIIADNYFGFVANTHKTDLFSHPYSFQTPGVVSNLAALYWRIVGQGQLAIKCLKHALYFSDDNARVSNNSIESPLNCNLVYQNYPLSLM